MASVHALAFFHILKSLLSLCVWSTWTPLHLFSTFVSMTVSPSYTFIVTGEKQLKAKMVCWAVICFDVGVWTQFDDLR